MCCSRYIAEIKLDPNVAIRLEGRQQPLTEVRPEIERILVQRLLRRQTAHHHDIKRQQHHETENTNPNRARLASNFALVGNGSRNPSQGRQAALNSDHKGGASNC